MLASGADESLVSLVPARFSVCLIRVCLFVLWPLVQTKVSQASSLLVCQCVCVCLFLGLWRRRKSRKPTSSHPVLFSRTVRYRRGDNDLTYFSLNPLGITPHCLNGVGATPVRVDNVLASHWRRDAVDLALGRSHLKASQQFHVVG